MSNSGPRNELAVPIFSASLTLMAILIGVIGIFTSEIGQLEDKNLGYLATTQKVLLHWTTVYFLITAWSAFFSLLALSGLSISRYFYLVPVAVGLLGVAIGVPVWVWS